MEDLTLKFKYYSSLLLVVGLLFACKPEEQQLPAKSHEGRNTLGYRFASGKVVGGSIENSEITELDEGKISIKYIYQVRHGWKKFLVEDYVLNLILAEDSLTGEYVLDNTSEYAVFGEDRMLSPVDPNVFVVDFHDASRQIISGTFELVFVDADSVLTEDSTYVLDINSSTTLSDGRFDVRY